MEKESLALEKDNRVKIKKILGRLGIKADSSKYKKRIWRYWWIVEKCKIV